MTYEVPASLGASLDLHLVGKQGWSAYSIRRKKGGCLDRVGRGVTTYQGINLDPSLCICKLIPCALLPLVVGNSPPLPLGGAPSLLIVGEGTCSQGLKARVLECALSWELICYQSFAP